MSDIELCHLFSLSEEFKDVTVRQDEKTELSELLYRVPIPIEKSLEEPGTKVNILLQAYIYRLKVKGLSLTSDTVFISESAGRLMRALFEIVLKRGWAQLAEKALNLCKMVNKRICCVQAPLPRFDWIENATLMELEKRQSPKLKLAAHVQAITRTILMVELTITPDFRWEDGIHAHVEPFWVIVEDNGREFLLHNEYFLLKKQYTGKDHTLNFTVPIYEPLPPQYFIKVVSDRWLGSLSVLPVSFRHLILPEKYPPPTDLPDSQPLPVTALYNPLYEALYRNYKHFNPLQTQVFSVLYDMDHNVLIAAPTGSGKTICAEFAILRNHQKGYKSTMRAVYIAPVEALAKDQYNEWKKKFGDGLGLRVRELIGELTTDLESLEEGQVIISTPERWHALSRRWKQRIHVQQVSLFIVDGLHLIGGVGGHVLEVIVSRMRRIASQGYNIRIVALSTSLANAKELGEWIGATFYGYCSFLPGATSQVLFNFPPGVRPAPLDVHIQGIDIGNFEAKMQALIKHTYFQHAKNGKQVIVFVPSKKQAWLTAEHLMAYSRANSEYSGAGNREKRLFLLQSEMELDGIKDIMLKKTLTYGVGYLHAGLTTSDQDIVKTLFETGCIQVCVVSGTICLGGSLRAHLVVVMGTQYYDGWGNAPTDYADTDLLQMMGHVTRVDNSGRCVIFCLTPRIEYYKKFLFETFPVESHLHKHLHDILNGEVVVQGITNNEEGITNNEDAIDYLTRTFMYMRLTQNPNYYNLQGVSQGHLSEHLYKLVLKTLIDLKSSCFLDIPKFFGHTGFSVSPLDLGKIASYYCISYTTIKMFNASLTSKTKLKRLLEILASASEYEQLPVRPGEEDLIRKLIHHQRFPLESLKYADPHVKAIALLQAHFSRQLVSGCLGSDQQEVLLTASTLLHAMVDVMSSNGWLSGTLLAMEVSQMVTQGMWQRDSDLLQLPHFTPDLAKRFKENLGRSIETVFELVDMEDDERRDILQMSDSQLMDIEKFFNRFPNIDISYKVHVHPCKKHWQCTGSLCCKDINTEGMVFDLEVTLERGLDDSKVGPGPVDCPRYPRAKEERWWLVVGDTESDEVLAIKGVSLQRKTMVVLDNITAPGDAGKKNFTLYFICDSYMGCDQEYNFSADVEAAAL